LLRRRIACLRIERERLVFDLPPSALRTWRRGRAAPQKSAPARSTWPIRSHWPGSRGRHWRPSQWYRCAMRRNYSRLSLAYAFKKLESSPRLSRVGRTPRGGSSRDTAPVGTSEPAWTAPSRTARHPTCTGIKHEVIGIPDNDHVAAGLLAPPRLDPEVEHVVEIDIRQERRCTAVLRRPFFHPHSLPILHHAGVQPFLDEPRRRTLLQRMPEAALAR
jgi:hypothetical protein